MEKEGSGMNLRFQMLRQTDTTVLNPIISLKERVARFTSSLFEPCDINENRLTQIKVFVGAKIFYRKHALAYPNHSSKTCGGPEACTSTTIIKKCGGKIAQGHEHYILKPVWSCPQKLPTDTVAQLIEQLHVMQMSLVRNLAVSIFLFIFLHSVFYAT